MSDSSDSHSYIHRFEHVKVRECDAMIEYVTGIKTPRKCNICGIKPDRGLECSWGIRQLFFCRICAFTKADALKLWANQVLLYQGKK